MKLMKISIAILITIVLSHVAQFADAGPAPTWTPGTPCTGPGGKCIVEIFDHNGIGPTSSGSAVFRVRNPRTPSGPAPYLDLYNPTLATIEKCARMVRSIKKPRPGSVRLRAREYTLSGSDRVVFLVDRCKKLRGPGPGDGHPDDGPGHPDDGSGHPDDGSGHPDDGSGGGDPSACASGYTPTDTSCSEGPGGWQTVTNTLSEDSCNLGYEDEHAGPGQRVIYDNSYSVTCNGSSYEPSVYVGPTMGDSNWGAFNTPSEECRLQTGDHPDGSGTRVVQKILCP